MRIVASRLVRVLATAAGAALVARPAVAIAQAVPADAPVQDYPVAARRLPRGTVLNAGDVSVVRVASRAPAAPVAPGWVTRRVIEQGEVLRPPAVAPAPVVAPGQRILYVVLSPGLRLTMDGRATSGGRLGDKVAVRLGANRRVQGVVTAAGEVTATDTTKTPEGSR